MKRLVIAGLSLCTILSSILPSVPVFAQEASENIPQIEMETETPEVPEVPQVPETQEPTTPETEVPEGDTTIPETETPVVPEEENNEEEENKEDTEEDEETKRDLTKEIVVSKVVNGVEITLKADGDAFKEESEITLNVVEITDARVDAAVKTIEDKLIKGNTELKSYRLFDITPMSEDKEVQPVKPVQITYKNLTLQDEDGKVIDVRKKIEDDKKKEKEKENKKFDLLKLFDKEDEEEGEIKAYHFDNPESPNEITVDANKEETMTTLEHFSWMLIGSQKPTGSEYETGKGESFTGEGGQYTLDYILSNYNVFCSGDYLGTHVIGPMVVGGETMLHGSLGGLSASTGMGDGQYLHTAPSYLEGYAFNENNVTSLPEIITGRTDLPIYLGQSNVNKKTDKGDTHKITPLYFKTPKDAYGKEKDGIQDTSKMYVDFARVFPTNVKNLGEDGQQLNEFNLPKYGISDSTIVTGQGADANPIVTNHFRPWNKNDSVIKDYTTDNTEPNGILYGDPVDPAPGSINYYRNFDGHDSNGRPVKKVHIKKSYIDEILALTNDGQTEDENGNKKPMNVVEDRMAGYTRYYGFDSQGKVAPVDKLNKMNNWRGATQKDFETYKDTIDKMDYAFAIDTLNSEFRLGSSGSNEVGQLPTINVSVRLRPGFNFTFDEISTNRQNEVQGTIYYGKVSNVVYDYITDTEMSGKLTIININEHKEQVLLPKIYKSVANDSFGNNYMFSSIEKGPAFSVLWFAPYCREVYVGFKTPQVNDQKTDQNANGSKLVGHLVVPQADVWIGGGDYNGGIIARNVDASTSGSEGHMWPFLIGAYVPGVTLNGVKRVDGHDPAPNEKFYFKYELYKEGNDKVLNSGILEPNSSGQFTHFFPSDDLEGYGEGNYHIYVKEISDIKDLDGKTDAEKQAYQQLIDTYTFDNRTYRGDFKVTKKLDNHTNPTDIDPSDAVIIWNVKYGNGEYQKMEHLSEIIFNNCSKKALKVKKKWLNEKGKDITNTIKDREITYDIYRDSQPPLGHKVSVEIYSKADDGIEYYASTQELGYVNTGENISFNVMCDDYYYDKWGTKYPSINYATEPEVSLRIGTSDGIQTTKLQTTGTDGYGLGLLLGTSIKLNGIKNDVVVKVVFGTQTIQVNQKSKDEYIHVGGFTSDLGEIQDLFDGKPVIIKNARSVKPKADAFSVNEKGYNNHWNYPDFNVNVKQATKVIENATLSQPNWLKEHKDLAIKDERGFPYYYKIVEHVVPGYTSTISEPVFKLTDNVEKEIEIVNQKSNAVDLRIRKVDADNENALIDGTNVAKFVLTKNKIYGEATPMNFDFISGPTYKVNTNGQTTELVTSNGIIDIIGLKPGTYYLTEIDAPDGYVIDNTPIKIIVDKDNVTVSRRPKGSNDYGPGTVISPKDSVYEFDFENHRAGGPELPGTGGLGLFKQTIVGISFVVIGLFLIERYRRQLTKGGSL